MTGRAALPVAMLLAAGVPAATPARDYGQLGPTTPVIEPDLLAMIEAKLKAAAASGRIAAMQKDLVRRTTAKVRRPPPVTGIGHTVQRRTWTYDPTITVADDIHDHKGRLIIPAGRRLNPLDTVGLRQSLVFVDGDDAAQVAWAMRSTTIRNAKLILVSGSPFDLMKAQQRRFFFDQGGRLTGRFGIRRVPAVVEQAGRVLKVTELPLAGTAARGAG